MVNAATAAIADPVRRQILELLRDQPTPAGEIARHFPISRPAISRHLRILRESGLVRDDLVGRRRVYTVDPAPLGEIAAWITGFQPAPTAWSERFDALETEVARARRGHPHRSAPTTASTAAPRHEESA